MRSAKPPGGMALQRQAMMLHDPQHPLCIDRRAAFRPQATVQQRRDAPVAIGRPSVDDGPDARQELGILDLAIRPRGFTVLPRRSLIWQRATSSASFRISFSIVLRPSTRSTSRTFSAVDHRRRRCTEVITSTRENGPSGAFDLVVLIGGCLCLIGYATWPVKTGCAPLTSLPSS